MQAGLSPTDQAYVDEVRAFIAAHWRPVTGSQMHVAGALAQERTWTAALAARGWSVPDWPVEYGGTGWPSHWLYLWRCELARAGIPTLNEAGVDWAGPAIWTWGDAAQRAQFLPAIRDGREHWCLGLMEPEAGADYAATATSAVRGAAYYVVDGCKAWVSGAEQANFMLALAKTDSTANPANAFSLLVIDLADPGVTVHATALQGDLPGISTVYFAGVLVPFERRLGVEGAGLEAVRWLTRLGDRRVEPAVALRVLAQQLEAVAAEMPGDPGALTDDPAFARKLAELGVDLAGLEALEARVVWERSSDRDLVLERSSDRDLACSSEQAIAPTGTEVLPLVLRLRHARIAERIGELFVEALGYYSLPYPDPLSIDNEGPIGHHYALAALRGMFAGRLPSVDGATAEVLVDRIANQLSGY